MFSWTSFYIAVRSSRTLHEGGIEIHLRGDCCFSSPRIMRWLERGGVGHVMGLPSNSLALLKVEPQ